MVWIPSLNGITMCPNGDVSPSKEEGIHTINAHILVGRYKDHQSLYRQAQIFARQGIDLDPTTLAAMSGCA